MHKPQASTAKQRQQIIFFEDMSERNRLRDKLEDTPLIIAVEYWRDYERSKYQNNYKEEIDEMLKHNIIPETFADGKVFMVAALRHISLKAVVDYIKKRDEWSESKKEHITDCYTNLIKWLNKISYGWFKANLHAYQMSLRAFEQTLTFPEWRTFIETLYKKNRRDELIARALLQGQKRVSDVIKLTIEQIDFENNTIRYESKGKIDEVCYETSFMKELQEYIQSTSNLRKDSHFVFITRTGKPVTRLRLNYSFAQVNKLAPSITKHVTPDSLRGIWKMFIQQKYKETAIMQSKKARIEKSMLNQETSK